MMIKHVESDCIPCLKADIGQLERRVAVLEGRIEVLRKTQNAILDELGLKRVWVGEQLDKESLELVLIEDGGKK